MPPSGHSGGAAIQAPPQEPLIWNKAYLRGRIKLDYCRGPRENEGHHSSVGRNGGVASPRHFLEVIVKSRYTRTDVEVLVCGGIVTETGFERAARRG
jgi:hypothetical protein